VTRPPEDRARAALEESARLLREAAERLARPVVDLSERVAGVLRQGGRVLACGNGGSAADAQHVAAELAGRFRLERPPLDVLSLTTNPSLVTALANDYGFEEIFARQVEAHGRPGDVILLFTTSGTSENVVRALESAKRIGLWAAGFTGLGGASFASRCDSALVVPSHDVPRIQEVHIALGHALCECVEALLFGAGGTARGMDAGENPGRERR